MKERRFEYIDQKSRKYWIISTDEDKLEMTARFGRIGNKSQISVKMFNSVEEMEKKYESLIKSKVKKGYIEKGE